MASPIDAATMANLLEITGGDQGFVDELVDTYVAEGDRIVGELVAAADAGVVADLVRPAHSLKSSSLNVGALELGDLCRRAVDLGFHEDLEGHSVTSKLVCRVDWKMEFKED